MDECGATGGGRSAQKLPLAFLERDDHAGALVHTGIVARPIGVDAVRTHEFPGAVKCIAQRGPERRRAGRRGSERAPGGIGENQPAIKGIGGERVRRRRIVGLEIRGAEFQADLLYRVAFGSIRSPREW